MGEYAEYVWGSYIVTVLVLVLVTVLSLIEYKKVKARVDALEAGPDEEDAVPEGAASATIHVVEDDTP